MEIDSALDRLKHMPFEDLGFAKVDHHRALRHGMPEVVFGKGKTPEQIVAIAERLLERAPNVLITRADDAACGTSVHGTFPTPSTSRCRGAIRVWRDRTVHGKGKIAVVCAGTSDSSWRKKRRSPRK